MPEGDRILLHAVARAVIVCERGPLEDQLERRPKLKNRCRRRFVPRSAVANLSGSHCRAAGFDFLQRPRRISSGRTRIRDAAGRGTVDAGALVQHHRQQDDFGFQVTETGAGYTWSVNSRENRLTPWSNDAVSDPPGEIDYLRDEDTGTSGRRRLCRFARPSPTSIRHGQGYTVFEHTSHGISQELLLFAPLDAPVKISLLRLRNRTDRKRRLSITHYNELVLGVQRTRPRLTSSPRSMSSQGAIFAQQSFQ